MMPPGGAVTDLSKDMFDIVMEDMEESKKKWIVQNDIRNTT